MIARRQFIKNGLPVFALCAINPLGSFASLPKNNFKIGACDWSIGKSSDIGAFALAREIGLQGLMVNMGSKENGLHLRQKTLQQQYLAESKRNGVAIASLAIAELNNSPYKSDPQTEQWVYDSVEVAANLGVKVVLLAFFHNNDLRNDEKGIQETINRLKRVAPHAEHHGIVLGIESYLDGAQHLRILEAVGSKNIKVYLDFRNTADAGYDVLKEVKLIGSENICELHMKENGALLGKGSLPWSEIRDLLAEINYFGDGWMQIESANPNGSDVITNYKHNLQFLQKLFSESL
jgi:L-ribulose-5-phosphate 3-epimerase